MKLLTFPQKETPQLAPDEKAVSMVEDLLVWCKSGAVRHVAIIGVLEDGTVVDGWSSGVYRPYTMLGALTKMQQEYAAREIQSRCE